MIETGIDMVEIKRIQKSILNPRFLARVFSNEEQLLLQSRGLSTVQTAAANFAAKEAFVKVLGCGFSDGVTLQQISVLRNTQGKPYYKLTGRALEKAELTGMKFSVSLSHTKEYACAVALGYCEDVLPTL